MSHTFYLKPFTFFTNIDPLYYYKGVQLRLFQRAFATKA